MFARLLLAVLVVANVGYFLWARAAANAPGDREPERVTRQIQPQLLEIRRTPAAAPAAPSPSPQPPQ